MENPRRRVRCGLLAAVVVALAGCATGGGGEVDLPPQTLTEGPTSTAVEEQALVPSGREQPAEEPPEDEAGAEDAAAGEDEVAAAEPESSRRDTIVIQSGTVTDVTPRSLYEASTVERRRRAAAETPVAVITNSNLAEQAAGGQLTVLSEPAEVARATTPPDDASPGAAGGTAAASAPSAAPTLGEEYWRAQALKIRLDWKAAVETVDELTGEVEELRRRFYAEDDPHYRDNQIKPQWDRALDSLSDARTDAEELERRLSRLLEEGRRAGALPGWLREGVEFEPPATPDRTPAQRRRSDDPWEPDILEDDARDP
jgi:hypothetical protein